MSTEKLPNDLTDEEIVRAISLAEEMSKKVQIIPEPPEQKNSYSDYLWRRSHYFLVYYKV